MSNKNIGLSYIAIALFGLLCVGYLHDKGGVITSVICLFFGLNMLLILIDGLLIYYGKKLPSGVD